MSFVDISAPQNILIILLVVLFIFLVRTYILHMIDIRNESEYKDIVEYETMLVSSLISANPEFIPTIGQIRYFPDKSGFFVVLNMSGKLLVHGDYEGDLSTPSSLPFALNIPEIVDIARNGGGYLKHNYKGYMFHSFIYASPGSSYIVMSGMYMDTDHIARRHEWKRVNKLIGKKHRGDMGSKQPGNL